MRKPRPTGVDFETFYIEGRPDYPPVPVGVSIKLWGNKSRYYSWGHASGNNCSWADAKVALELAWSNPDGVLFHHAKFDLAVAARHFQMPMLPWDKVHDTLLLLFLHDNNETELGLKPSGERLLGLPPEERDALAEWLVEHQPISGVKITNSTSKQAKAPYVKYIAYAPGDVAGPYANGDTARTEGIFDMLWTSVVKERGMGVAYDRERRLLQVLLEVEPRGVQIDLERLRSDVELYQNWMFMIDDWLLKRLKSPELNPNSGHQVIEALIKLGEIRDELAPRTADGHYASDEPTVKTIVPDKQLAATLIYRSALKTCLKTFMEKWLAVAERSGGLIYTDWFQTRGERGGGTRTGRLSSSPNFQNIPKMFEALFKRDAWKIENPITRKSFIRTAPNPVWKDLPDLPLVRSYVVPDKGHVLIDRDYSQQEPRILAHFEGGVMRQQYLDEPWLDFHDKAKENLVEIYKRDFNRTQVKIINLGLIYGEGVPSLAAKNKETVEMTRELHTAILAMYPGLQDLRKEMKRRAAAKEPFYTWGGRECFCEPPGIFKGKIRDFAYKMVNTLVQGSAGDCTKEATIRYHESTKGREDRFLLTVHDQTLASVPKKDIKRAMERMRVAMESVEFGVPMLSEGKWSSTDWASLQHFDKKGKLYYGVQTT